MSNSRVSLVTAKPHVCTSGLRARMRFKISPTYLWTLVLISCLTGPVAFAGELPASSGIEWATLTPPQQDFLKRFEARWSQLPPDRQMNLANGAQHWLAMTPDERARSQQQLAHWHALPPEQRTQIRDRVREFRSLPPQAQEQIRAHFQRFSHLSAEQRQRLKARWHALTPDQRRGAQAELRRTPAPDGAEQ